MPTEGVFSRIDELIVERYRAIRAFALAFDEFSFFSKVSPSSLGICSITRHVFKLRQVVCDVEPRRFIFDEDMTLYFDVGIGVQRAKRKTINTPCIVESRDNNRPTSSTKRTELARRRFVKGQHILSREKLEMFCFHRRASSKRSATNC